MNDQKIWFVSDVHFFHNNILKFCPATRHGETALEMNEYIIQAWNSKVHRRDIVYNLGDVSFGSVKDTDEVLSRLTVEELLKPFQDFWSSLPDSKAVHRFPFFPVCDLAESCCFGLIYDEADCDPDHEVDSPDDDPKSCYHC